MGTRKKPEAVVAPPPPAETPKISTQLTDLVTQYLQTRGQRLSLDAEAEKIKSFEEELKKSVIAKMQEQNLTEAGTGAGMVRLTCTPEPVADNWPEVWAYIAANNAWELLHKRLTNTAVKERTDAGEKIPGISFHPVYRLSPSKAR